MVDKLIEKGVQSCSDAQFEEGVKYFDQALKLSPDNLQALSNRARALSRVDKLIEALVDFKRLVDLQPVNPQFMSDYAVALHLNDRNDEASDMFDKALALEPENPYRYSSRAFFKDRIGDSEGAIVDYDKCIALDPEDAIALNNRGLVEEKLGYQQKAKKSFDQSNKLVGYQPDEKKERSSTIESSDLKKSTLNHEIPQLTTKWEVVKSVFTKDGFKDFVKFSGGLLTGKNKGKS